MSECQIRLISIKHLILWKLYLKSEFAQYNAGIGSGTEGIKHTYVGVDAGANATYAAIDNSFFGTGAGYNNTSGDYNTFLGMAAGYRNTDGKSNTFVGMYTGVYNTTGNWNTFLGMKAGRDNTTGNSNTFVGTGAGHDNTVGKRNSFFGTNAGRTINGDDNTFIGVNAGFNSSTGSSNTVVGTEGGYSSAGSSNVFIGRKAGRNSRGSRNVFIGNEAGAYVGAYSSDPENDKLYIENGSHNAPLIKGDFADQTLAIYGRVGINGAVNQNDELYVNGSAFAIDGWLVPSDKRYKKDIQTIDSALDKVNALNGVTYSFKQETINNIDFSKQKGEKQIGVIAQELEEVLPELVRKDESGYYAVNYDGLVPVLVEAVKEQQDEITDLRTRLEKLESLLNDTVKTIVCQSMKILTVVRSYWTKTLRIHSVVTPQLSTNYLTG